MFHSSGVKFGRGLSLGASGLQKSLSVFRRPGLGELFSAVPGVFLIPLAYLEL